MQPEIHIHDERHVNISILFMASSFVIPSFSQRDYGSFFLAGALCCTISHGAMTREFISSAHSLSVAYLLSSKAIDVVKTRIQIDPAFKSHNFISGTRSIVAKEGAGGLLTGFGPTAVGYLAQGGAKFAGYEYWKRSFILIAGDQETAIRNRTAIYLGAATIAESVFRLYFCSKNRVLTIGLLDSSLISSLPPSKRPASVSYQTAVLQLALLLASRV